MCALLCAWSVSVQTPPRNSDYEPPPPTAACTGRRWLRDRSRSRLYLGAPPMPITVYLDGYKPDPETKRAMGVAFEMTRAALRLVDRDDLAVAIIAKKTIELAKAGERNPELLCERAIRH